VDFPLLYIYIYIYIYIPAQSCVYTYICVYVCVYVTCACAHTDTPHHRTAGPFSTESLESRFHESRGYGRVCIFGSSVTPRRASLLDPPLVRTGMSLSPSPRLVAVRPRLFDFVHRHLCVSTRGSLPVSRPRRTTLSLDSLLLSVRAAGARLPLDLSRPRGALCPFARPADAVCASVCPAVSPPLLVVGPENLTRARLRHRPPYELRAYVNQYICKSFFLCFFPRCEPHFFYIITFSLSLFSLTSLA
jgi:hypothetical protein